MEPLGEEVDGVVVCEGKGAVTGKFKVTWMDLDLEPRGSALEGRFCLSMCPGKKISKGRDGKAYDRSILGDVETLKDKGISTIVCLINKYELRTLGVKEDRYI